MRYNKIRQMDISNGPGVRVSIFMQGCSFNCKNCFNKETHDFCGGKEFDDNTIERVLELCDNENIEGLSILGGEPMHPTNIEGTTKLAKAFKADSVNAEEQRVVDSIMRPLMEKAYQAVMNKRVMDQEKALREAEEQAKVNIEAGKAFVDSLKAADKEVKTTESGLSYKVVTLGTGAKATDKDKVAVVYTGKLIDGTEFDSSKGEAVKFSPRQVVPGFGEALKTFPVGTKVTLYIPEDLGYGKRAQGKIAPGSTLIFDLEIKEIEVKDAKK